MSRVELLQAQQELIEAIDSRYEVELISEETLVIMLPDLPKVMTTAITVPKAKTLLSEPVTLDAVLQNLEQRQVITVLEQLKFAAGRSIGTGEMALKNKSNVFTKPGSDITVTLITATVPNTGSPSIRRFNSAIVQKPLADNGSAHRFFRKPAKTATELIDALAKAQGAV